MGELTINLLSKVITNLNNEVNDLNKKFEKFFSIVLDKKCVEEGVCDDPDQEDLLDNTEVTFIEKSFQDNNENKKLRRCGNKHLKNLILPLAKEFTSEDFREALRKNDFCFTDYCVSTKLKFCINYGLIGMTDNGTYTNLYKDDPDKFDFATPENRDKFRKNNAYKGYKIAFNELRDSFTRDEMKAVCRKNGLRENLLADEIRDFELFGFVKVNNKNSFERKQNF